MEEPLRTVQGDDQPLVAQIEGFESFVERNHERLYGALCLLTKDRYEAEDIAQEAFVRSSSDGTGFAGSTTRRRTSSGPR